MIVARLFLYFQASGYSPYFEYLTIFKHLNCSNTRMRCSVIFSLDSMLQFQHGKIQFYLGFCFISVYVVAKQIFHDFSTQLHQ